MSLKSILSSFIIIILSVKPTVGQDDGLSVVLDSTSYEVICPEISKMFDAQSRFIDYNTILSGLFSDSLNIAMLQKFATGFDCMLELGLELNNEFPEVRRISMYSLDSTQNELFKSKRDENERKIKVLDLKFLYYELKVKYDEKREDLNREKLLFLISDVIVYGRYKYPRTVQRILNGSYDHIVKEEFYKEMRRRHRGN